MRKILKPWLILILCLYINPVSALPITDTIVVGDKEWAQLDLFTELSWSDIWRTCTVGGCADFQLNGFDMLGWQWAGLAEIKHLFNTVTSTSLFNVGSAEPEGCLDCDNVYADALITAGFRPTGGNARIFSGWMTGDCLQLGGGICSFSYTGKPASNINSSSFDTFVGSYIGNRAVPAIGGWFYRDAPANVPLPPSIALLILGLIGLQLTAPSRLPRHVGTAQNKTRSVPSLN